MTSCKARIICYAHDYGYTDCPDYYCLGYQCDHDPHSKGLCKAHLKSLPFGKFKQKAPDYALAKGKMENDVSVVKDEALCWLFPKPDIDDDGNLLIDNQEPLTDDYWQCDHPASYYNECDDCDD